jgi:hypothetical protein
MPIKDPPPASKIYYQKIRRARKTSRRSLALSSLPKQIYSLAAIVFLVFSWIFSLPQNRRLRSCGTKPPACGISASATGKEGPGLTI